MIEEMKKATIISLSSRRHQTVKELRKLGLVHIIDLVSKSDSSVLVEKDNEKLYAVLGALADMTGKKEVIEDKNMEADKLSKLVSNLYDLLGEKKNVNDRLVRLTQERDKVKWLGDFDPAEVDALKEAGLGFSLYIISAKDREKLKSDENVTFITLRDGKQPLIASIGGTIDRSYGASPVELPQRPLSDMEADIVLSQKRIEEIDGILKDSRSYVKAMKSLYDANEEEILFRRAEGSFAEDDSIIHIQGYLPAKDEAKLIECAKKNSWGYLIEEPAEEDLPPTLVNYKGPVRIIKPVFDILGTVPGYREYDISSYFLVFFALFFAMIIGDAGYGLIFLLAAIGMNIASKKASDLNILLYVLAVVTMVWGALTGTWFGSEAILAKLPFLQHLVIPSLTNFPELMGVDANYAQNTMMQFCFILGAVQLSLACVINIMHKIPKKDLSWIGDLGWLMDILVLYLLVLFLAVGKQGVNMGLVAGVVGVGFVLVCVFGSQQPGVPFVQGLKSGLGGCFTTFLDTVSCFSNIMSYIRLFAVGMASLAIAQSFNDMAAPMLHGFALPAGILIILIGHTLNLVMGLLSVVVHGVRLNLLEFSGQLGMEWSGYNYEPFCEKGTN